MDEFGKITLEPSGDILVGEYTLELGLAAELNPKITFTVTSTSTVISPKFSSVVLLQQEYKVGDYLEVSLSARNENNATIYDLDSVLKYVYCHAKNEQDRIIDLNIVE